MAKKPRAKPDPKKEPSHIGTYFTSLTVENIRSFGSAQTLDLTKNGRPAQWTVILGDNNLGKSTLLEVLYLQSLMEPTFGNASRGMDADDWEGIVDISSSLRRIRSANLSSVKFDVAECDIMNNSSIVKRRSHKHPTTFLGTVADLDRTCFLYGSRELPAKSIRSASEWLIEVDYQALAERNVAFADHRSKTFRLLTSILPDVQNLRIQHPLRPGAGKSEVQALMPDGLWVSVDQLGSGYKAQIAWLVDFASRLFMRYPDSPDPLAEPAICLIDELDLHLHPKWQRQIIGYLSERFPRTQFIVTAHSPLIVQAAEDANLVLLRRAGAEVVIDNDPERLQGWRVDQILASELFGLESTRPPSVEALEKERRELLRRPARAAAANARIREIEAQLLTLPGTGEKPGDREAMDIIRAAAAKLRGGS